MQMDMILYGRIVPRYVLDARFHRHHVSSVVTAAMTVKLSMSNIGKILSKPPLSWLVKFDRVHSENCLGVAHYHEVF
jgi:hypothetical protein